jgi:hypothetical protein
MNWQALLPALGALGGAAIGGPAGGLAGASLGASLGGAAGAGAGAFLPPPNGMPPIPQTQLPGRPPMGSQPTIASLFAQGLQPGQKGFLKHPFV